MIFERQRETMNIWWARQNRAHGRDRWTHTRDSPLCGWCGMRGDGCCTVSVERRVDPFVKQRHKIILNEANCIIIGKLIWGSSHGLKWMAAQLCHRDAVSRCTDSCLHSGTVPLSSPVERPPNPLIANCINALHRFFFWGGAFYWFADGNWASQLVHI